MVSQHDGGFLTASLTQRGSGNTADSDQSGYFNEKTLLLNGNGNFAAIAQFGTAGSYADRNIANVTQTGCGLTANVSQSGSRNVSNIDANQFFAEWPGSHRTEAHEQAAGGRSAG